MNEKFEALLLSTAIIAVNSIAVVYSAVQLVWSVILNLLALGVKRKTAHPGVVLITGASSGIGQALAINYARPNTTLIITGRNEERLREVAAECSSLGSRVIVGVLDVSDREGMEAFLLKCDDELPIDLLIANAGASAASLGSLGLEQTTTKLNEINLLGVFNTVLPLLQRFKQRKAGQIVVISSLSALFDFPRGLAYSSGKTALNVYFTNLRQVMQHYNVKVNIVCPGYVETGLTVHTRRAGRSTPGIVGANEAAAIIIKRLETNDAIIAFPLYYYILTFAMRSLPPFVIGSLLNAVSQKVEWSSLG